MLKKIPFVIFLFILQIIGISHAADDNEQSYIPNIEMYGTSEELAAKLMKKHDERLRTLYQEIIKMILSDPNSPNYLEDYDLVKQMADSIKDDLMKEGDFSFINISNIFYYDEKSLYITLDVVDKNDNEKRNSFLQLPSNNIEDKSGLVTAMMAYETRGEELFKQGKVNLDIIDCPAYHCTFGFKNEELKSYLAKFNTAEQHEKELIDILTNDADPEKRAVVTFLIGHFNNPDKIIELLTPALDDSDDGVRNNALRVMVATVLKVEDPNIQVLGVNVINDSDKDEHKNVYQEVVSKTKSQHLDLPIEKIIKAINDPSAANRAKALIILYELINKDTKYHQYVKTNAGYVLVNLLKLKQPGNHTGAYMVLKKISGEDYDERDIDAWEKWVSNS